MVSIGVIGAGYWGRNLVRTFAGLPDVRLAHICDSDADVLAKFASYGDANRTADYAAVIADPDVDAVAVATPPVNHHEIALAALDAGKHVFVEKPLTLDEEHARELVAAAEANDRRLMVGHLLLYHPCITFIKDMIGSGELGEVYYIYSHRLNLGRVRADENALLSFAPHDISIVNHLIGTMPETVTATGQSYLRRGVEDVAFMNIAYPGGKMAHIHVSWLDPHKVRRTTVVGSRKMVVFDDMEPREKIRVYDKGVNMGGEYGSYGEFLSLRDGNISIPAIKMSEPLKLECEHFIDCVRTGNRPMSDGRNGLVVTGILAAAQRSLVAGGKPVDVHV